MRVNSLCHFLDSGTDTKFSELRKFMSVIPVKSSCFIVIWPANSSRKNVQPSNRHVNAR